MNTYFLQTTMTDWQVCQLIKADPAQFPARTLSETLGVSHSGYYDWVKRTLSQRTIVQNEEK